MKVNNLHQRLSKLAEQLAQQTDAARAQMADFLQFALRVGVERYSIGNMLMIWSQFPGASRVAGYRAWQKMGRQVRKGEKGIAIFCPVPLPPADDDPEQKPRLTFRVGYVFDVSQTDGPPLPPEPDWKSPATLPEVQERLIAWATSQGIHVAVQDLLGETQGLSYGDGRIMLSTEAGLKTLVHELVHEFFHRQADRLGRPRKDLEVEAESAAYLVCTTLGVPTNCPNYLALHGADGKAVIAALESIVHAAATILGAADPDRFGPQAEAEAEAEAEVA